MNGQHSPGANPPAGSPRGSRVGERIAHYELVARLGAGGMGEVYRARDSKLGRDVAIKVLPDVYLANADRCARFEREARVLAAISHPHIGAIYGVEHASGLRALVLELVEGQTVAERLAEGRFPLEEALTVARQIAEALEAAHEKGIVHRDLKPANIMFGAAGTVKVLDFGLAKLDGADISGSGLSQSPTLTSGGTVDGLILGTAAYLSPEQARGRTLDKRTDIWAFGCMLYEMLTGRRVFARDTTSDTISAILTQEPDWGTLPDDVPPAVRRLLQRCLTKDPRRRLHDIADARLDIDEVLASPNRSGRASANLEGPFSSVRRRPNRLPWMLLTLAALALLITSTLAIRFYRRTPETGRPVRFTLAPPGPVTFSPTANFVAISPDGRQLAFVANTAQGIPSIWIRPIGSLGAQLLQGTENARQPFWSPDSRFIGFFVAGGLIKMIAATGGPPQILSTGAIATGTGATWNRDGVILFSSLAGPIQRVSATGSAAPIGVTTRNDAHQEIGHSFPYFLPDGRRFLYFVRSTVPEHNGIYLRNLESAEERLLIHASSNAAYVPPGYLLYVRDGVLMAEPFDATKGVITGEPFGIADGIDYFPESGIASFSASDTGALVYRSSQDAAVSHLLWFDRKGNRIGEAGEAAPYRNPRLSPDGKRLAVEQVDGTGNRDIWIIDLARHVPVRFTFDPGRDASPVWSADGQKIAWQGNDGVYLKSSNGTGREERLRDQPWIPDDWQPDGHALLLHPAAPRQVWRLSFDGTDRTARPVIEGRGITSHARVSPDGRWVAFANADNGRFEIFIQNYPDVSGRWQVSTGGGIQPKWRHDGQHFLVNRQDVVATPVTVVLDWPALVGKRP